MPTGSSPTIRRSTPRQGRACQPSLLPRRCTRAGLETLDVVRRLFDMVGCARGAVMVGLHHATRQKCAGALQHRIRRSGHDMGIDQLDIPQQVEMDRTRLSRL